MQKSKILIAAGGTGGHLFPAQALAEQLLEKNADIELFFAGAKLSTNAYLDKERFRFVEIASMTPFRGNLIKAFVSMGILLKGIKQSCQLLSKEKPHLVVGFGSFHVFPLLCAARLLKIPYFLFESNAIPGKVVRLFSKRARLTGVYFSEAKHTLKGKTAQVEIPTKKTASSNFSKQQAREQLHLNTDLTTLLIFGGSQGAQGINKQVLSMLPLLQTHVRFQIIHLTGSEETAQQSSELCLSLGIPCYAKKFEKNMDILWKAADVAICRAGAMTLSELLAHEVPGLLIPFPAASDQHQLKNALVLEKNVGGAIHLVESTLTPEKLLATILPLVDPHSAKSSEMKAAIKHYKTHEKRADFCRLILDNHE